MQYLGVSYEMKHAPKLDPTFVPFGVWAEAYLKGAQKPIAIAVEREKGKVSVHHTKIYGTAEMAAEVVNALKQRSGALIANHGAITVGRTLAEAYTA
ncbi:MAG: class II aldolase/adducin family protein, partial [Clostridia bacterium]|nr:class II aldolase/adducin family protein [Clostridia bacterium]